MKKGWKITLIVVASVLIFIMGALAIYFWWPWHKEFFDNDPMKRQETIELVRAYYKIPNRKAAKHLYDLIIAMSKTAYNGNDITEEE